MSGTGTLHMVDANKRHQIGDHIAELEVVSDLGIISAKKIVTFEI